MQYLLSKEEYDQITCTDKKKIVIDRAELQKLCTLAAQHVPVDRDWDINDKSPWGCITGDKNPGYCDECPSSKLCPYENKEYSQ